MNVPVEESILGNITSFIISYACNDLSENVYAFYYDGLHRSVFRLKSENAVFAVEGLYSCFIIEQYDGDITVFDIACSADDNAVAVHDACLYHALALDTQGKKLVAERRPCRAEIDIAFTVFNSEYRCACGDLTEYRYLSRRRLLLLVAGTDCAAFTLLLFDVAFSFEPLKIRMYGRGAFYADGGFDIAHRWGIAELLYSTADIIIYSLLQRSKNFHNSFFLSVFIIIRIHYITLISKSQTFVRIFLKNFVKIENMFIKYEERKAKQEGFMDYCKEVGYREMAEETEKLKKECAVEVFSIGKSVRGREISCLSLGSGRKSVLFVGVHHGMERITAALALKFARDIAEGTIWGDETAKVLSKRRIYIIPMLNPDGAEIALGRTDENERYMLSRMRGGDELACWQANARGVDLNHNYNAGFDLCREEERRMGIFTAGSTRYGGKYAESEPETHALCDFTRSISTGLRAAVALHTQGEEIYYDYCGKTPEGGEALARIMAEKSGYTLAKPDAIASHGGYKDWVIEQLDIPAFTLECGLGKNPLSPTDFPAIYVRLAPTFAEIVTF